MATVVNDDGVTVERTTVSRLEDGGVLINIMIVSKNHTRHEGHAVRLTAEQAQTLGINPQ